MEAPFVPEALDYLRVTREELTPPAANGQPSLPQTPGLGSYFAPSLMAGLYQPPRPQDLGHLLWVGWGALGPIQPGLAQNSARGSRPLPTAPTMNVGLTGVWEAWFP